LRWKVEEGEKDVYPSLSKGNQAWNIPRATKLGTFFWLPSKNASPLTSKHDSFQGPLINMEHSKGHYLGTFHWPPNWGFSFASFLPLLFKGENLDHLLFFFGDMIFNLNFWQLVPTTFFRRRRMINPSRWWK